MIAALLGQMGRLAEDEGDLSIAERHYAQALSIFERLHSPYAEMARRDLQHVREKLGK